MHTIRTKWHKVAPLVDADEVYLTSPSNNLPLGKGEEGAKHWSLYGADVEAFRALLRVCDKLPKFVIDPDLIGLAKKDEAQKSMLDMQRAGVLRLPYPVMLVELPMRDSHAIVLLRDLGAKQVFPWEHPDVHINPGLLGEPPKFYCYVIRIHRDEDGEYLVITPSILHITVKEDPDHPGEALIGVQAGTSNMFKQSEALEKLVEKTFKKDIGIGYHGLFAALLLMATAGVEREVIEVERLNKRRALSNKPPIPRHTYIHIGRVYRSAHGTESDEYVPRRSPIPHWRRGHLKNVRYGTGKEKLRQVYIEPKLVAYHGIEVEPSRPEYTVKM